MFQSSKPNHTKPNQISWYGMVRHGLDQDENSEPVLPLKIFEISAFLSHFLGKKQRKLDLTHFQMEFQPIQGAKTTGQMGPIFEPNLKKIKIYVFWGLRKYCPDKNHSHILLSHFHDQSQVPFRQAHLCASFGTFQWSVGDLVWLL